MVLGFNPQFVSPILKGTKKHTIRHDVHNRWKEGRSIQFATGVRTTKYNCFKVGVCKSVQTIEFKWNLEIMSVDIIVDGKTLYFDDVVALAKADGFDDVDTFLKWDSWYKVNFKGKLIHWTDLKYEHGKVV